MLTASPHSLELKEVVRCLSGLGSLDLHTVTEAEGEPSSAGLARLKMDVAPVRSNANVKLCLISISVE